MTQKKFFDANLLQPNTINNTETSSLHLTPLTHLGLHRQLYRIFLEMFPITYKIKNSWSPYDQPTLSHVVTGGENSS